MKKGLLIFLLLIPASLALECVTYDDCDKIDCAGSARFCVEGSCLQSGCISGAMPATDSFNSFILFGSKAAMMVIAVIIIALLAPLVKTNSKAKIVIVTLVFVGIITASYFFMKDDARALFFGEQTNEADPQMKAMASALGDGFVVDEEWHRGAPQYRLQEKWNEAVLITVPPESEPAVEERLKAGRMMAYTKNGIYAVYSWKEGEKRYVLIGEDAFIGRLFKNLPESTPVLPEQTKHDFGYPPMIHLITPNDLTHGREVRFVVSDNDSLIDQSSITVDGVPGFGRYDCIYVNGSYVCSFDADISPGEHSISISATDETGRTGTLEHRFLYDTLAWELIELYPANSSYTNTAKLSFGLRDPESGMDIDSIDVSLNASCTSSGTTISCESSGLPDGWYEYNVTAADLAGNYRSISLALGVDTQRPVIGITNEGFTIEENVRLDEDSLMVDRKRWSAENCNILSGVYHCRYEKSFMAVSVSDEAGNHATAENRRTR
jgi:hypothetical protein